MNKGPNKLEYIADKIRPLIENDLYMQTIVDFHYNTSMRKPSWRLPDKPSPAPTKEPAKNDYRAQILSPLDGVFIDDSLKDEIIIRTAIPDLLEGNEPSHNGVILYGPPGTGKTVLLKAIRDVYHRAGAYAQEASVSAVNSKWVGEFAKNLEEIIVKAVSESKNRGKPSFLFFDEASSLAQNAQEGSGGVSKHYQEAIDTLKRYIGNERGLVLAMSTNLLSESFEDALTREGRLTSFLIDFPDGEQRGRMWTYFASKYGVLGLNESQAAKLAEVTPREQGAFIEEFCRTVKRNVRGQLLKAKGHKTLIDALKVRANVTEADINGALNFEVLYQAVLNSLESKFRRKNGKDEEKKSIGFS